MRPTRDIPKHPIKIAILDTGYDEEADFFLPRERSRQVRDWKDFASNSSSPEDFDGHGTHVVALAMKMAPFADIYVARVAQDTKKLQGAGENIAKV
jgi:subtilisin family serine protease